MATSTQVSKDFKVGQKFRVLTSDGKQAHLFFRRAGLLPGDIIEVAREQYLGLDSFDVRVYRKGQDITDSLSGLGKQSAFIMKREIKKGYVELLGSRSKSDSQHLVSNNDGLTACFACGGKTRPYGAVHGLPAMGHICTKCGL